MNSKCHVPYAIRYKPTGEVSERPKEHDWKSCFRRKAERGFKSRPLRFSEKGLAPLNQKETYVL